jgi:ribosomal protein S18 acetylase RimI-like enzyme
MGDTMNIRRATAHDAPLLARIHVDAWQAAYRGVVPASHLANFTYERREAAFRQALAANLEETYLIESDDQAIGILTLGASRDADLDTRRTGEIWGIYITPRYWHQGIGTRLVAEAEQMLQARGYRDIVLWVLEDNLNARRFYEKTGFALDGGSRLVDLGKPLKAVRYHKVLNVPNKDQALS